MSSNIANSVAYLRTTRDFPEEPTQLRMELNKSYIDTANAVNSRTIGLYPSTRPAITGNEYFLSANKQQSLRQIYSVTGAGTIPHGINTSNIAGFVQIYGSFTDGTNFYPLPWVDVTAATNQVTVYIDPTNINIVAGSGAPAIVSGTVVLEWLSNQ